MLALGDGVDADPEALRHRQRLPASLHCAGGYQAQATAGRWRRDDRLLVEVQLLACEGRSSEWREVSSTCGRFLPIDATPAHIYPPRKSVCTFLGHVEITLVR